MSFRQVAATAILLALALLSSAAEDAPPEKDLYAALNPPAVAGVSVARVGATSAEIEWPASLSTAAAFRAEFRNFTVVDGELKMTWVNFPGATIKRHGETFRAQLSGLLPRQPYWIRILPGGTALAASEPLFAVRFQTSAKAPLFTARRATIGALIAALGVLAWLRWVPRAR